MNERDTRGEYIIYPVEYVDPKPSVKTDLFSEKQELSDLLRETIDSILGPTTARKSDGKKSK